VTVSIAELNRMDRDAFVRAIGWVFEDSPWVAREAAERRPFADVDALHAAMVAAVANADAPRQLALLRAHPDLGTRARMTDASRGEQADAGLDRLASDDFATLQRLNTAYREKFGFPFLFAVKGSTSRQILAALEQRLPRATDEEFAEAMQQVYRIARFRLDDLITFRTQCPPSGGPSSG
jgi:2-oxo-4-hydroxy-4-carboxy-5-ureidoimidazoline decarboxylase